MKGYKRIIIIFISFVIIIQMLLCMLDYLERHVYGYDDYLEHHEYDNYLDVESVEIEYETFCSGEPLFKKYVEPDDIKKILRKIKRINFYADPEKLPLQESPTEQIVITYKDGTKKEITFAGGVVLVNTGIFGSDSYEVEHYSVGLIEKEKFFRTLPKSK